LSDIKISEADSAGAAGYGPVGVDHGPLERKRRTPGVATAGVEHSPGLKRRAAGEESARNRSDYIYHRLLAVSDVAAIALAGLAAFLVADALGRGGDSSAFIWSMALMVPIWLLIAYFAGLYHQVDYRIGQDLVDEFGPVLVAVTAWAWLFVLVRSLLSDGIADITRAVLMWIFVAAALLVFRSALRFWTRRQQWNRRSIAVIGDPEDVAALVCRIHRHPEWCMDIRAQIQPDPDDPAIYLIGGKNGDDPRPEREGGMVEYLRARGIDRAMVIGASESLSARSALIRNLAYEGIAIDHVVGGPETLYSTASPQHLEGLTMMSMRPSRQPPVSNAMKRGLDILLAAALLLVALPVLALSAIAIKVGSSGPVFFRQARSGKDGKPFHVLKLRTMTKDADDQRDQLRESHPALEDGELFKIPDDPRITGVGRRLRRWSIDEIPQLWNVLTGDMSLVGPRPLPLDEAPLVVDEFKLRQRVRPGMTGPWQVMGRSDIPAEDMLRLDYTYVIGWTFAEDLKLLMRTATAVIGGKGVS
jgi:exopolysaccharide biosynthesis polyprenyl glycosylphosphotransferase